MLSTCVLCGGAADEAFQKNNHPIYRCQECSHAFAIPAPPADHVESVYGDDYFFGGKDGYPNYLDEASLLEKRGKRYARLVRKYVQPGEMLDVGAAAGFLLNGFSSEGWKGVGLEPNPGMVRYGRDELGLDMVCGTLETYQADRQFDLVSLIQVIAHLNDAPAAFQGLSRLVKDNGILLVETWNEESLTAKLLGKNWHEYSPPSVLHWFSPARLEAALARYGFERIGQGRTLKWISVRHAASLASYVLGNKNASKLQSKLPRSLAVPYPSEDLFWGIYRKSTGLAPDSGN